VGTRHAGLPRNELAESLAKTEATLPLRLGTPATLLGDEIFLTTPSSAIRVHRFSKELAISRLARYELSPTSLPRLQPFLVLLPMQDLTYLLLDCPASEPL